MKVCYVIHHIGLTLLRNFLFSVLDKLFDFVMKPFSTISCKIDRAV